MTSTLVASPQFSGVIIDRQPIRNKPGSYWVQLATVPDVFVKGVHYNGKTNPSALADQLTAEVKKAEKSPFWAFPQIYDGDLNWKDPEKRVSDLQQLVDDAPMPPEEQAELKETIARMDAAKLLASGSVYDKKEVLGRMPDAPFLRFSINGSSEFLPKK